MLSCISLMPQQLWQFWNLHTEAHLLAFAWQPPYLGALPLLPTTLTWVTTLPEKPFIALALKAPWAHTFLEALILHSTCMLTWEVNIQVWCSISEPFKRETVPKSPVFPQGPAHSLEQSRCSVNAHWVLIDRQAGRLPCVVGANALPGACGSHAGPPLCTVDQCHALGTVHVWHSWNDHMIRNSVSGEGEIVRVPEKD